MNQRKLMVILLALLMVAGFQVQAQRGEGRGYGPGGGRGMGYGPGDGMGRGEGYGMMDRLDEVLDLTDDQQEKIEQLHLEARKENVQVRNQIGEKQARMRTLMSADQVNQSDVNQLIDEVSTLRATIRKNQVDTHLKVRNVLTEEQRLKFDAGFHRGFGKGGGPRGWHGMHGRGWD